jgi:pyruvate-formate lyase-activating enzyme
VADSNQTAEVCLAAVQRNGDALQYVADSNQTAEVCLAAVQRNGDALQYVKRAAFEAAKIVLVEGVKYALNKVA